MLAKQMFELTNKVLSDQLMLVNALTQATFNGMSKLNHLNTSTASTALAESQVILRALLEARDAQEAAALLQAQWSPGAAKAASYSRHLALISSALQDECRLAALRQLAQARARLEQAQSEANTSSPGDAETVHAMRNAVDTAGGAWVQVTEAAKQSRDAFQQTVDLALDNWLGANTPGPAARPGAH